MGTSQNLGCYLLAGPNDKDFGILESILGFPDFGKIPYRVVEGCMAVCGDT